jgi:monoamine oxidase
LSRTPLYHMLRRSLAQAQLSLRTGVPVDETIETTRTARAAHALSRREFLAASAAAAALVSIEGCAPAFTRQPTVTSGDDGPVLIVGAGIAGLTAAYRLRQQGVAVRIIEAQNRIGGRMYSLRNFFADGQSVELGGELIDTNHTHIQALAQELGIVLDDLSVETPGLTLDTFFFEGRVYSEREVVNALLPVAEAISRDVGRIADVTYAYPNGAERLDRMSVTRWLDRVGLRGWIRKLIDVAYTTEYGLEPEQQSALNLLLMLNARRRSFALFGNSDERYRVRDGNDRIPQALADKLSDAIERNTVLEAISRGSDGRYALSLQRGGTTVEARARQVILAIPFTLLREVRIDVDLPPVKQRAIRELAYGTNAKLMVGFSERVWRTRYSSNGSTLTDLPSQLTWETSRHQAGQSGVLTNFTGGRHGVELGAGTAGEQASALVRDLDRIFPGIAGLRAGMKEVRFHWPSHPYTKGSYSSYLPGQWTGFRGVEGESVDGLHFAGEHCSLEAQGFMEGGCETGEAAAQRVLKQRGVRTGMTNPRRLLMSA